MSNLRAGVATALLVAGAATEVAAVFVLWYFTTAWSDYVFAGLFCLSMALVFSAGVEWIRGHFDMERAALNQAYGRRTENSVTDQSRQASPSKGDQVT